MVDDFELDQLRRHPEWRATLQAYQDLQTAAREQSPEFDGWIPRVVDLEGIDAKTLPSIHGKLIAFGFLKFDLAGRDAGMRYQLTPQGKQALVGKISMDEEPSDEESTLAQSA